MSMPNPKKTAVRVQKVRLYPDSEMKQVLDELCDYTADTAGTKHWRSGMTCTNSH